MVLQPVHVEPFPIMMWHEGRADTPSISLHITGPSQRPRVDKPHTPSYSIHRRHPACGRRARQERRCADGVELSVSQTGTVTTGSFHRIPCNGMNYRTGFLWSISFTIREPTDTMTIITILRIVVCFQRRHATRRHSHTARTLCQFVQTLR
jgi:hypothetical protein